MSKKQKLDDDEQMKINQACMLIMNTFITSESMETEKPNLSMYA